MLYLYTVLVNTLFHPNPTLILVMIYTNWSLLLIT